MQGKLNKLILDNDAEVGKISPSKSWVALAFASSLRPCF